MASRHRSKHGHIALAVLDEHVMAPWRLPRPRAVCTAVIIPGHPHAATPHARTAGSDVVDDVRRSAEEGIAVDLEGPSRSLVPRGVKVAGAG
jgi:hypothetical protein